MLSISTSLDGMNSNMMPEKPLKSDANNPGNDATIVENCAGSPKKLVTSNIGNAMGKSKRVIPKNPII